MRERVKRWTPENVVEFIEWCREDGGVPQFRATVGGMPFKVDGEYAVLAVCWGGKTRGNEAVLFTGVPKEDLVEILTRRGEWRYFLALFKEKLSRED
ncbi:MAG: hypothetical protein DRJ67_03670 [Thermoprotei archaeon]|nr:MAG: hypothetical protein DRJ67_03670 [Thermoprotei archaeon]